jgi:hypothetical protein
MLWHSKWRHCFWNGHWQNYFMQLGQAVRASARTIFLRCVWYWLSIKGFVKIDRIGTVRIPDRQINCQNRIVKIPSQYWNHIGSHTWSFGDTRRYQPIPGLSGIVWYLILSAFENAPNCDNNASFRGRVGLQNQTFKWVFNLPSLCNDLLDDLIAK